jgi:hypothetical protein
MGVALGPDVGNAQRTCDKAPASYTVGPVRTRTWLLNLVLALLAVILVMAVVVGANEVWSCSVRTGENPRFGQSPVTPLPCPSPTDQASTACLSYGSDDTSQRYLYEDATGFSCVRSWWD